MHDECDFRLGGHVLTDEIKLRCLDAFLEAEQIKPRRLGCVARADYTRILINRDAIGDGTAFGRGRLPTEFACAVALGIDVTFPVRLPSTA